MKVFHRPQNGYFLLLVKQTSCIWAERRSITGTRPSLPVSRDVHRSFRGTRPSLPVSRGVHRYQVRFQTLLYSKGGLSETGQFITIGKKISDLRYQPNNLVDIFHQRIM